MRKNFLILISLLTLLALFLAACSSNSGELGEVTGEAIDEPEDTPVRVSRTDAEEETRDITDVVEKDERPVLDAPELSESDDETVEYVIRSEEEDLPEPEKLIERDPQVLKLIHRAKETTRYKYAARETPLLRQITHYYVSDHKMKLVLPEQDYYVKETYFNTVYLDTRDKTAIAFCEDRVRCPDLNKPFDVEYSDYETLTPRDWTLLVEERLDAKVVSQEIIHQRPAIIVEFEMDEDIYRISLDHFFGLVTHVEINPGSANSEEYMYEITGLNVGEDELVHRFMS